MATLRTNKTETLIPASFKGVPIDVMNTRDSVQRAVAEHSYPFTDGADIEDLGESARRISMTLVWSGVDYKSKLAAFLKVAQTAGSGSLIHPAFGETTAQYASGDVTHDADQPEYCELRVEFIEHTLGSPSFSKLTTASQLAGVDQVATQANAQAARGLAKGAAALKASKLKTMIDDMNNMLTRAKLFARTVGASDVSSLGLGGLTEPLSFASDMERIFKARVNGLLSPFKTIGAVVGRSAAAGSATLAPYAPSGAVAHWAVPAAHLRLALTDTPVDPVLAVHIRQQQALALAVLAASLFEIELQTPALTPQDIETVVNDARADLQAAIAATQAVYPLLIDSRPMTEGLKAVAAGLQAAALALIQARPPFIARRVPANMNLHLLAHHWYADYARADELLRLNPQIKNPNFLVQGQLVYGYAS